MKTNRPSPSNDHRAIGSRNRLLAGVFLAMLGIVSVLTSQTLHAQEPAPRQEIPVEAATDQKAILAIMKRVADRNMPNPQQYPKNIADWVTGPFWNGVIALSKIPGQEHYAKVFLEIGQKEKWRVFQSQWGANDHCAPQSYLELYEIYSDPAILAPTVSALDRFMAGGEKLDGNLEYKPSNFKNKWSWADTLYMSPPAFARLAKITGNSKYLTYLNTWWWRFSDAYYDSQEKLFFRDHTMLQRHEPNGKKVFWSRANGWAVGGLVRVLEYLPKNDPYRPRYEKQLSEMCSRLAELQSPDGLWPAGLLDPSWQSESSGSAFFVYGMAYGINQGLLDRDKFLPVVKRGWNGLVACVSPEGKFEKVQPVGDKPAKFAPTTSIAYGNGAFLLAGSEMMKLAEAGLLTDGKPVPPAAKVIPSPSNP